MNIYTHHSTVVDRQRQDLEVLIGRTEHDYTTAYHPRHLIKLLAQFGKGVVNWLTAGSLPRVSKEFRGNREIWTVYDPMLERTLRFDDESGLRAWIEDRYNH